jgi:hypothetical protein
LHDVFVERQERDEKIENKQLSAFPDEAAGMCLESINILQY